MVFKKGTYIIGDLCYILNDKSWDIVCDFSDKNGHYEDKDIDNSKCFFKLGEYDCWIHGTAFGDGSYPISMSDKTFKNVKNTDKRWFDGIDVDSGSIGIIPLEVAQNDLYSEDFSFDTASFMIVEIDDDFEPYYENGTFYFSDINIETSFDEDDEEFDDEEEEE